MASASSTSLSRELQPPVAGVAVGVESTEGCARVCLAGELDLAGREVVADALAVAERDAPALLIVDLTRLELIDSSGLRVLLAARRRADEQGRRLVLVPGGRAVCRALEITGLDALFEVPDAGASSAEVPAA